MVQCPLCARVQEPRIVCIDCQAPLAANLDYFAALDLPRKLIVDLGHLEDTYHGIGRQVHPDRFATQTVKVREASSRVTATLTRAYRTLRDPVARGGYWLELNGHKLAANNQQVPAELADLVFDTQEELADLRQAPGAPDVIAKLRDREAVVRRQLDQLGVELTRNFAAFDRMNGASPDQLFGELKQNLSQTAYLRTLLRDLEKTLDSAAKA
jgi:DnaJ-domain-containing protein 1